jgi:hypothetical protein
MAEPLFKRAIAIGEKALGLGHPLTQRYCSNCAPLFPDTGRPAEALSFARAALATHETTYGAEPSVDQGLRSRDG